MQTPAAKLIDAFGGTSKTATLAGLPISTVHSWRKNGIPRSRLSHLRIVAQVERPELDFDRLAAGVECPPKARTTADIAA
jgi:hypothetical protein